MTSLHAVIDAPQPPLPTNDERWALFLDVDGTLVGFDDEPEVVRVPADLLATLDALRTALDGALAVVSGRRLRDLERMFGAEQRAAAGLHGLQRRRADGSEHDVHPDPAVVDALHREVAMLAATLPGVQVEDKGPCIALHYRQAPGQQAAALAGARRIADTLHAYELQPGNHVVELKPAGMDKGLAVQAFLREAPFAGRTPVYLGDDLTDEHAFTTVNAEDGLSVRIGHRQPSAARFMLHNPAAVQDWLDAVLARLTTPPSN